MGYPHVTYKSYQVLTIRYFLLYRFFFFSSSVDPPSQNTGGHTWIFNSRFWEKKKSDKLTMKLKYSPDSICYRILSMQPITCQHKPDALCRRHISLSVSVHRWHKRKEDGGESEEFSSRRVLLPTPVDVANHTPRTSDESDALCCLLQHVRVVGGVQQSCQRLLASPSTQLFGGSTTDRGVWSTVQQTTGQGRHDDDVRCTHHSTLHRYYASLCSLYFTCLWRSFI